VKFHIDHISCGKLTITNEFFRRIKEKQLEDSNLRHIVDVLGSEKARDFEFGADGLLRFKGRLCIPADEELNRMILEEGHKSHLSLHPGMTKMYQGFEGVLLVVRYEERHQKPGGLLQQLDIPEWKWDNIAWILLPICQGQ